ncbi:hypothetical protein U9M48_041515, partial [Paspalum notatum var. saurae]
MEGKICSEVQQNERDNRLTQNTGIFETSIWGDFFLGYSNPAASSQQQNKMAERAETLKEQVAEIIADSTGLHEWLNIIDTLERLCLDHLFENEIDAALREMEAVDVSDYDLNTVALWFCLLRKHRYRVSPDVFTGFKDDEGAFPSDNPAELLSLYNAAHMRTHGEVILDEAILFTRRHLETMLPSLEGALAREIKSSLEIPHPRRVRIYESKYYISTYEKDAMAHEKVLELAKVNSNIMQLHHQHELSIITRWWQDIQIESRLPFARDRLVECYWWILGVYFEPSYSRGRIIMTMVIALCTMMDDIYDSYGTQEECEIFTNWDTKGAHDLPDCMKLALEKILASYQTIANMLNKEEKYRMSYLRYRIEEQARGYNNEVKMLQEGYIPKSIEEHLKLSLITGGCPFLACASFVGMHDIATKDCFDWVSSVPKMVQTLSIILRIVDDLQSYEREQLIPHVSSTIDSYMKEHNVSIDVTREKIHILKEDSWKDFNITGADIQLDKDDGILLQLRGQFHKLPQYKGYHPFIAQMVERANALKEEVAKIIASSNVSSLHERLHIIDTLERLCLDHLFEHEIDAALQKIVAADVRDYGLRTVALWYCLLRKHRYNVSSDVFVRFRDEEGGFLTDNPTDLLGLFNAAHMRTHGDIILDEAIPFSGRRLEMMSPYLEGSIAREVKSALEIPYPRRVRIYESKHYISAYEKDATVNDRVLQLAKLNSNIMQLHHQHELSIITRWWKDIQVESRLPFARDRVVECYLWMLGVYFEPHYSRGRIILTMTIAIIGLLDDIYDSYGTPKECEIFTKCIESWDTKGAHDLPECMKFALEKILDSYQTIANMLNQEEKCRMSYLRYFIEEQVRGYNTEVKMLQEGYIPKSIEEHLKISLITGGCPFLACASFIGMHDIATKDCFDWVSSIPKMVQSLSIILRIVDDIQSHGREQLIPHVASTIDSYMKEHNVSIDVACEKMHIIKEESWKDFNNEWLNPENTYPKQLLERIFNLARTMEFFYNQEDNFTNCHNIKDTIH